MAEKRRVSLTVVSPPKNRIFRFSTVNLNILVVLPYFSLAVSFSSHCYNDDTKSLECPVCSPHLNQLAEPLPFAHCAHSRLICSITGELMNEHNHPMMLPNGRVYGEKVRGDCQSLRSW